MPSNLRKLRGEHQKAMIWSVLIVILQAISGILVVGGARNMTSQGFFVAGSLNAGIYSNHSPIMAVL